MVDTPMAQARPRKCRGARGAPGFVLGVIAKALPPIQCKTSHTTWSVHIFRKVASGGPISHRILAQASQNLQSFANRSAHPVRIDPGDLDVELAKLELSESQLSDRRQLHKRRSL